MKKQAWVLLSASMISMSAFASGVANAVVERYQFDPNHTYVLWHAGHFDFSTQTGKLRASGTLLFDEKNPKNSKVDIVIHANHLATGVPEFDKHLAGKLFFNSEKFPTITFKSTEVNASSATAATVKGDLTLLGVTKPVTLDVTMTKRGVSPISNKYTMGFSGKTTVDRREFGMTALVPNITAEIPIDIQAELIREDGKNAN